MTTVCLHEEDKISLHCHFKWNYTLSESVNKIHMLQSCESKHDNEAAAAAAAEESLRSCTSSVVLCRQRGSQGQAV